MLSISIELTKLIFLNMNTSLDFIKSTNEFLNSFPGIYYKQDVSDQINFNLTQLSCPLKTYFQTQGITNVYYFWDLIAEVSKQDLIRELESIRINKAVGFLEYRLQLSIFNIPIEVKDVRWPLFSQEGIFLGYQGILMDSNLHLTQLEQILPVHWHKTFSLLIMGLIHDFNNIIAGIYSMSELYCSNLESTHDLYTGLYQIKKSAADAQKLVKKIHNINRNDLEKKDYHNLKTCILEHLEFIKVIAASNTVLKTSFPEEDLIVYINDVAFRKLVISLVMGLLSYLVEFVLRITCVISLDELSSSLEHCARICYTIEKCKDAVYSPLTLDNESFKSSVNRLNQKTFQALAKINLMTYNIVETTTDYVTFEMQIPLVNN